MKKIVNLKDIAILFGWVIGILIIISMIWFFSQPLQAYNLLRTVNNVFISNNDTYRLSGYIPQKSGKAGLFGYWYSVYNSRDLIFIFTVFQDGILIPIGAIVSVDARVEELIPLSAHAVHKFGALHHSVLQTYVKRIEAAAPAVIEGYTR